MGEYVSDSDRKKILNQITELANLAEQAGQKIIKLEKEIEELKRENHLLKSENTKLKFAREFKRVR